MRACQLLAAAVVAAVTAAGCGSSPSEPTPPTPVPCTFQLASSTTAFGFEGGAATVAVTTASGCAWSARSEVGWITIQSGASGSGPGTVGVAIAPNTSAGARDGLVVVADQSVRLTQQGPSPCTYTIAPTDARFESSGGTGTFAVTAAPHCTWSAATDPWITLSPASGSGNGVVSYTVAVWTGASERSGTIRVEGKEITIRQARDRSTCAYSVTPVDVTLHWHGPGGEIQVTTDADCTWTVRSTADWLQVPGGESRTGPATLPFVVGTLAADATRRASIEVRWPAPTAGQNVWITQEGCRYGAYPSTVAIGAAGGSEYVNVLTQPISPSCPLGCSWSAESAVSWIRIASGSPGSGDDRFRIEVSANSGPARSGTVRVGGQVVTVNQAGS